MKSNENKLILLRFAALILLGLLAEIGAAYLLNGIMNLSPALDEVSESYQGVVDNLTTMSPKMITQVIIVSPLVEEAVFRFIFIGLLMKVWSDYLKNSKAAVKEETRFWILNVVSALFFGIYHGNIVQGIYAFILGLMLGYVYYYFGKYIASLVVHMVINTSGLYLVGFLPAAGVAVSIAIGIAVLALCLCLIVWLKIKTVDKLIM